MSLLSREDFPILHNKFEPGMESGVNERKMAAVSSPSLLHAKDLLTRAVQLDEAKRYAEALICYEEAIQILIRSVSGW